MKKIVECVPNISNGRDASVYDAVASEAKLDGCKLLDVDPGVDTNRTVITFAGSPEAVEEAAFRVVRRATELIDMRAHKGAHPRHGAADVCPFVPVAGVTMDECAAMARRVGERIGALGIPVWLYDHAARKPEWRSLATVRAGEYEALDEKLGREEWRPDFGPNAFTDAVAKTGVVTVGARKFLIAYNINFNTRNVAIVNDIAMEIRETGRKGKPGLFKHCRGIGWYMEAFGCAQLSMNLTDWEETPPHVVYDKVLDLARERGLVVTGSELVGLIPLGAMRAAGRYFLEKQRLDGKSRVCSGVPEAELIRVAVRSLGLDDLKPFDPRKAIVEYAVDDASRPLASMTLGAFADELAGPSPAPGGGSVAALGGALAAGLGAMVANLTVGKKGFRKREIVEEMNRIAAEAQDHKDALLRAVDEDTAAFHALMANRSDPAALQRCIDVPMGVLERMPAVLRICLAVAERGNPNSLSDAGVGGEMALAAAQGAYYNVLINRGGPDARAEAALAEARALGETLRGVVGRGLSES